MSRAVRWGLTALLGAMGLAAVLRWERYVSTTELPAHLANIRTSSPGVDNVIRDELRLQGSNAVPALVKALNKRSWQEASWVDDLRQQYPPLARYLSGRLGDHAELGPTDLAVLGSLGPAATAVVPKLQQIAEHSPFITLRTAARRAVDRIEAKPKSE